MPPRKTIVMNVDYFDEVCIRKDPFAPEDVNELVSRCAKAGVDTICWRAIGLGVAGYPSRFLQNPQTLEDSDMSSFAPRMADMKDDPQAKPGKHFVLEVTRKSGYRQSIGGWGKRIAASLATMDPIAQARDACRRQGLQFYIWHDFLDERHNVSLARHPEWLVTGRDQSTRFPGLRAYGNPDAMADQLQVISELLAYKPDGLYLSTSCHNRHLQFSEPDDFFGFEAPVAAEYKRRVGRDICDQPLDTAVWNDIKGGFFTPFFRAVKTIVRPTGAKLAIGTQIGNETILTSPVFSTHIPYRFATQWKIWIDQGIADILVLGDYEWPWDTHPIWDARNMNWPAGSYAADREHARYADYAAGRAQLFWFSSWLSAYAQKHKGASSDSLAGAMQMRARTLLATGADGICLHEAMTFENEPDGFPTIADMRSRFIEKAEACSK